MKRICSMSDLAEGEMRDFQLDGREIIVTWPLGHTPRVYDAACPHEGISLTFGEFDGRVLVCGAHLWTFDTVTGCGIEPADCRLKALRMEIAGEDVLVEL